MTRLPRDVSGTKFARSLGKLGYKVTRQTGSHIRLTGTLGTQHHITIPNHSSLKVGTLNGILKDVASRMQLSRDELLKRLAL